MTTQSTFLKTSLTSNTIFKLAKDKEMFLLFQAACEGELEPWTQALTIKTII